MSNKTATAFDQIEHFVEFIEVGTELSTKLELRTYISLPLQLQLILTIETLFKSLPILQKQIHSSNRF